jgi:hypothetical protein
MIIGIMVKKGSLTNYGEKKDHLYFVSPYLQSMVKKMFSVKKWRVDFANDQNQLYV